MPKLLGKYTINGSKAGETILGENYSADLQQRGLIINGNGGDDTLKGGSGKDVLNGGDGNDVVIGDLTDLVGAGDGTIVWDGGRGTDTLDLSGIPSAAGTGLYVIFGTGPNGSGSSLSTDADRTDDHSLNWDVTISDTYTSNFRNFEKVLMGAGDDIALLAYGNETAWGGAGNDWLDGQRGNDTLYGGDGDDTIIGGWGSDLMSGGAGNDVFAFVGRLSSEYTRDTITDFETVNDQIWLYPGYSIIWDSQSTGALHGWLTDQSAVWGEITISNLTLAEASSVRWYNFDAQTGVPTVEAATDMIMI
jgi:Ca2+-binding RTX toxin-like protein